MSEEYQQTDELTDDENQWLMYIDSMALDVDLNRVVDRVTAENCHLIAQLLVKRKPRVAKMLCQELKWQIISLKK